MKRTDKRLVTAILSMSRSQARLHVAGILKQTVVVGKSPSANLFAKPSDKITLRPKEATRRPLQFNLAGIQLLKYNALSKIVARSMVMAAGLILSNPIRSS